MWCTRSTALEHDDEYVCVKPSAAPLGVCQDLQDLQEQPPRRPILLALRSVMDLRRQQGEVLGGACGWRTRKGK